MTTEQIEAEHVKALASSVYREMHHALAGEYAVRRITSRYKDHPAFIEYMTEMELTEKLDRFVSRTTLAAGEKEFPLDK